VPAPILVETPIRPPSAVERLILAIVVPTLIILFMSGVAGLYVLYDCPALIRWWAPLLTLGALSVTVVTMFRWRSWPTSS
jgi:hypothetical protein